MPKYKNFWKAACNKGDIEGRSYHGSDEETEPKTNKRPFQGILSCSHRSSYILTLYNNKTTLVIQ